MSSNTNKAILASIFAHTFWGFSFLASRIALESANMFILLSHRFLIAFLLLSVFVMTGRARVNLKGKRIHWLIALSLLQPVIYFLGEQYGILHSNTIFSGVMIALIPIASTFAAMLVLKEMPTALQLVFSALSISGVIGIGLLSSSSGALEPGGAAALMIAVCAAAAHLLISRAVASEFSSFERTYSMMAHAAVIFTACALVSVKGDITSYLSPVTKPGYLPCMLFLAVLCSVGSYGLNSYAITYLTVARQTAFSNLTTAVSVFAGAIFLHEPFSLRGVIYCAMILLGIYGVQKGAVDN